MLEWVKLKDSTGELKSWLWRKAILLRSEGPWLLHVTAEAWPQEARGGGWMSGTGAICLKISGWHSRVGPLAQPYQTLDLHKWGHDGLSYKPQQTPQCSSLLLEWKNNTADARDRPAKGERNTTEHILLRVAFPLYNFKNFLTGVYSLTCTEATAYKPTFTLLIGLCRWKVWCYAILRMIWHGYV